MRETRDLADRVRARWSARWLDRPTPLPEIPLQDLAIDRCERREVVNRYAFVGLVHGGADQAEFVRSARGVTKKRR